MQFSAVLIAALVANCALASPLNTHQHGNSLTATGGTSATGTRTAGGSMGTGMPTGKGGKKGKGSKGGSPSGTNSAHGPHSTGNATMNGLDSTQSKNAKAILQEIQKENLGSQSNKACWAVFATALQESQLYIYANPTVQGSMQLPHDKVGGDQDSVGIFQQRIADYPDLKADMDPAQSAGQFLKQLKAVPNWQTMETSDLCQTVQKAQAGNLYKDNVPQAQKICATSGGSTSASGSHTAPAHPSQTGHGKKSKGGNGTKTNSAHSQTRTRSSGGEQPTLPTQ